MSSRDELGYHNIERMALGFVLETETWPVFLAFVKSQGVSDEALEWVNGNPSLESLRTDYMLRSPNPLIRGLGLRRRMQERINDSNAGRQGQKDRGQNTGSSETGSA